MDGLTGIQFLEVLDNKPYIVITSAYAQYALKGYELCVFDYLLKPYSFERFIQAVNKIVDEKYAGHDKQQVKSGVPDTEWLKGVE